MKKTFKFLTCLFVAILCFGQMWATDYTIYQATSSGVDCSNATKTGVSVTFNSMKGVSSSPITSVESTTYGIAAGLKAPRWGGSGNGKNIAIVVSDNYTATITAYVQVNAANPTVTIKQTTESGTNVASVSCSAIETVYQVQATDLAAGTYYIKANDKVGLIKLVASVTATGGGGGDEDPVFTYTPATYTIGDEALDLSTKLSSTNTTGAITFAISTADAGTTGASIASSKNFTATTAGTAKVTVSQAASTGYNAKSQDIEVTVVEPDTKCFNMPLITSKPDDLASVTITGGTLTDANAASKAIEMDAKGLKFGGSAARLKVTLSSASIVENTKITVTYECTSDKGSGIAIYNGDYAHKTMSESVSGKGSGSWSHTFTADEAVNYADEFMIDRNGGGGAMIVRAITVEDCGPELTKHTITLNYSDGVTPNGTIKVIDGKAATKPADPTWAHHRFDGWYNGSDSYVWTATVSGNLTLTAHWTQLYTVTYAAGDGTATGDAPTQADKAATETFTVAANTFAVAGKDFVKWNDGTNDYAPGATYTVGTANVVLTAQWKVASAKYTVHYMDADGTTPLGDDELVEVGQKPAGISATKPLYTFASWQLSGSDIALDATSWASVAANAEVTLTARWTKIYATSYDMEAYAASDGASKSGLETALTSAGYAYSNIAGIDNGHTHNYIYDGMKWSNANNGYIEFNAPAKKVVVLKTGYMKSNTAAKMSVNGVEDGTVIESANESEETHKLYFWYNAEEALYRLTVNSNTANGTCVLKAVTICDPYQVSFDANGGDDVASLNGTPSVTLPSATKGTASLLGWFTAATGGTKIGNAGDTYFPTANITLHAQWEALSSDHTLSDLKVGGVTVDGFSSAVNSYYVVLPYGTKPENIPAISATANSEKAKQVSIQQAVWTGEPYNCYRAQANVQAEDESWGYYDVRFSFSPKDGVSLIKVTTTGGTNKTVTGVYAGDGDVSLSSSTKMDDGKYIGFILEGTTLQAGDKINVHTTEAASTGGSHIIFYDNMTDKNELYETGEIGGVGDNIFTINAAMVGATTAYVYRSNADNAHKWNGKVNYIEVTRAMNPILTAISFNGVAATKGTGNAYSITLPAAGTNLASLTVVPTVIRNAAHATTPETVVSNEGAWKEGANTYHVMDKDGDYTDYTITITLQGTAATPSISVQPQTQAYCAGSEPTLSVTASVTDGGTLHYAWYKEAGETDEAVGEDAASYTIASAGTYYVIVTNMVTGKTDASTTSNNAVITQNTAASITTQPESHNDVVSGSEVTLTIEASNATGYQWYSCDDADKTNAAAISGAESASYVFNCAANGFYYCVVGNACGDDIASNVVSVKLELQGCNTIASIPSEAPYQYEQRNGSNELEWTLYGIDSDGRINGSNKFVDNAKDFNDNTVNAITDQRVGIIFEKDVESITIYATAGSAGRTWKSDLQIRVTSDDVAADASKKPTYTDVSATRAVTTMPGNTKQYIFTAEDMFLEAGKKVWLPFSNTITIFKICYTAASELCAAPVLPTLNDKDLCTGDAFTAWNATSTVSDGGTMSYQWYNADTDAAIDGATNASFAPSADGNYYVIVTNSKTGYRDNSTKSATLNVVHYAAAVITTAPLNQRGSVGAEVTMTVEATGKNVAYKWYTCDEDGNNEVALDPAQTGTSLSVTITEGLAQWYKVKVTSDCGDAEAKAKVSEFQAATPANVTTSTIWDWTSSAWPASGQVAFSNTAASAPYELLADADPIVPNNDGFRSDMLYGKGQWVWRYGDNKFFQGSAIKFTTTVAGMVRVYFRSTGSGKTVSVAINGTAAGSRTNSFGWSDYVDVPAGEVEIICTGDGYTRIQQIDFVVPGCEDSEVNSGETNVSTLLNGANVTVHEGGTLVIDAAKTLNDLVIEEGGKIIADGVHQLTTGDFVISRGDAKSGQLIGTNVVSSSLNIEIKLKDGDMDAVASRDWYCISAPFDVALNGGFSWGDGTPMVYNVDFQLFEYDGEKRANSGNGWKRVSGNKMNANKAHFIGFDDERSNQNTIRLKAMSTVIPTATSIALGTYPGDEANANWNGVANPTLHYVGLDKSVSLFDVENQIFNAYAYNEYSFVVGAPLFVQSTGSINLSNEDYGQYYAPQRSREEDYSYCVRISKPEATRFDNQMYVRASENATNSFEQDHDMASLNGTTSARAALVWTENYNMRLAIQEAPLYNNTASYELGLSAPAAGEYVLSVTDEVANTSLYLTYNGSIMWDLSASPFTITLNQGVNYGYGLLMQVNAPHVATGVDNAEDNLNVKKIILNEHVYILRDGQLFDITGKIAK